MSWGYIGNAPVTMTDATSGPYAGDYVATVVCPVVLDGDLLIYISGSRRGGDSNVLLETVSIAPAGFTKLFESNNVTELWGMQVWTKVAAATDSLQTLSFVYPDDFNLPHGEFIVYRGVAGIDGTPGGFLISGSDILADKCTGIDGSHAQANFDSMAGFGAKSDDLYLAIAYANGYTGGETTPAGLTKRLAHSDGFTGILVYDHLGVGTGYTPTYGSTDIASSAGATLVFSFLATTTTGVAARPIQGIQRPWQKPGQFERARANTSTVGDFNPPPPIALNPGGSIGRRVGGLPWQPPGFGQLTKQGTQVQNGGHLILINNIGGSPLFKLIQ